MDFPPRGAERAERGELGERGEARPVSRRGVREYSGHSGHSRSETMRPASAYRSGTASRLGTSGFGAMPTTASRQPTAMTGIFMMDRPITQQGLSGLRTGTARGYRTRQTQDKRYWEEVMQVKIREMKAEISRLNEQAEAGEREKSAKKHYEKRVKELALELTDLQGRLSDYNTAIRIATGATTRQTVEEQAKELEESNQKMQADVEQVFLEKQRKEMQLRQLKEQLEKEQNTISILLAEMTPQKKEQYTQLEATATSLREEVQHSRSQLELLQQEKDDITKDISGSQVKVHMVELYRRLAAAEEKRDTLKQEITNRLQPQEEREKLLVQVREDNSAIASMDSNAATLKEQIRKVQELIEQAELDLQEGQSERHQKYRELKKREETIESFMLTYDETVKTELEKISQLEKDVVFALEHYSSNIDLDLTEIDSLKQKDGYAVEEGKTTVDGLMKEYERLQANLKKAEATRERLLVELHTLPEKCSAMEEELATLSDLERLRNEGAEQKKALEAELQVLREKLAPTESAVVEAASRLRTLQASLDGNEVYTKLNNLEEQLAHLENRKTVLEEDISCITMKTDYEPIKKQALEQVQQLNSDIIKVAAMTVNHR